MKKNWNFSPELGLFLFFTTVMAFLAVGIVYWLIIRYSGMIITSWWRSPSKNTEVGGVSNSLHMIGLAWDVVPVTEENTAKLQRLGLRVINEGDHLHAQIL